MQRARAVPNPATPRQLRPVHLITDRAKRYRAHKANPPGPKRCGFCGAKNPRDIDHLDGDEGNGARRNLMRLCRSCNVRKGITQARAGAGRRTRQYNPQRAPTFSEYVDAVLVLRGDDPGDVVRAAQILQATSDAARTDYVGRIVANPLFAPQTGFRATKFKGVRYGLEIDVTGRGRWEEGPIYRTRAEAEREGRKIEKRDGFPYRVKATRDARNPGDRTTYAEYARAVSIHRRGAHDEGGAIIHATPKELRSKYARRFAASKRKRSSEVPF